MDIFLLLKIALSLLIAVQNPGTPEPLRLQAISIASHSLAVAQVELSHMQEIQAQSKLSASEVQVTSVIPVTTIQAPALSVGGSLSTSENSIVNQSSTTTVIAEEPTAPVTPAPRIRPAICSCTVYSCYRERLNAQCDLYDK